MGWGLGLIRIRQREMGRAGCRHLWSANKGHGRQTWQLAVGSLAWLWGKLNPSQMYVLGSSESCQEQMVEVSGDTKGEGS